MILDATPGMVFKRISDGQIMGTSLQFGTLHNSEEMDSESNYVEIEITEDIKLMFKDWEIENS